jgi:type IV secretion system protein VirB10
MNSDVPGNFTAKISQNVYDTKTGQHLLVPQGATIGGTDQGETLLYGNQRLPTVALQLVIEDRTYDLGKAPVTDQVGTNGLTGEVDNHYGRLASAVLISGVLKGGQQMLQAELAQAGGVGYVATGIGTSGNQAAQQRIGRALDTRPTIQVFPGQGCQVLLTKPLTLPVVWQ